MIKGIVEMISGDNVLVGFSDGTYKTYENVSSLNINENDEVEINDSKIIKNLGVNKKIYNDIKDLENKIFKNK